MHYCIVGKASVDLVVVVGLDVVDYSIDFYADTEMEEPGTEDVKLDTEAFELE